MNSRVLEAPVGCRVRRRRRLLRLLATPVGLLALQACGAPAPRSVSAVSVREEPSAAEIHAGQAQDVGNVAATAAQPERLLDSYWKLIELGGRLVVAPGQREPHLILHREGSRVSAHGGCNRLSGTFSLAGDRINFGRLVSTRLACEPGARLEAGFSAALAASAAWRVQGPHLELFDGAGRRLARFEERHL